MRSVGRAACPWDREPRGVSFWSSRQPPRVGWAIVTLANDAVFDWAVALLASLARYAPGRTVRVIPYDSRLERLGTAMAALGNAEVWTPPALEAWDALAVRAYPDEPAAARVFRKLASFQAPTERFIFLDADSVALAPLDELFAAIESSDADFVHFDTDIEQVYLPSSWREAMREQGRAIGFNSGLFAGRSGTLAPAHLESAIRSLPGPWREYLVPFAEQAFLNLAVDHAGLSLRGAWELLGGVCSTCWPAVGRLDEEQGVFRLRESGRWDEGWRFLFAHWAGYQLSEAIPNHSVWAGFRALAKV